MKSKNCPPACTNPQMLMWEWSLPEVLELDEMITMWDAVEEAVHKDNEAKEKRG